MKNNSIAYKLSVYISLAVIAVFIVFILLSYFYNQNILKEKIEKEAIEKSSLIIGKIRKYVLTTSEVASNVSDQIYFYHKAGEADNFLLSVMQKYRFIYKSHVLIEDGSMVTHYESHRSETQPDVKIHENDNFINRFSNDEFRKSLTDSVSGWTNAYIEEKTNQHFISFYKPFRIVNNSNKTVTGRVIFELSLSELNDTLHSKASSKNELSIILDKNGTYILHPKREWMMVKNIDKMPLKFYRDNREKLLEIIKSEKSGSMIIYPEFWDFEKSWAYFSYFKDINWTLIFCMPYDTLFLPLYLTMLRMLFASVLGILVIYFIISYITKRLIEPLKAATIELKSFSSNAGEVPTTSNEIKLLNESLEYLKRWYESYKLQNAGEQKIRDNITNDLHQAAEIQKSFIKSSYPVFQGRREIDLFSVYQPANIVSGDLYDYFFIDQDNLMITLGDVSGKGIAAAIFMGVSLAIVKNNANSTKARKIVASANNELCTNNQHQFFLTLFLGVLNLKTLKLTYCNAAHSNSFVVKNNGDLYPLNKSHGLPLGLYPEKNYNDSEVQLHKGDTILLFSDGFIDQLNPLNQHFGEKRLVEYLKQNSGLAPKVLVNEIIKQTKLFADNTPQTDDMSIVAVKLSD
jgi:sigma-B regulation protein RsbU (phosphoserine phosphatase)